jgi:hypothetical protein
MQKCQDFRGSKAFVSAIFEFVKFPTRYEWSKIRGTVQRQVIGDTWGPFGKLANPFSCSNTAIKCSSTPTIKASRLLQAYVFFWCSRVGKSNVLLWKLCRKIGYLLVLTLPRTSLTIRLVPLHSFFFFLILCILKTIMHHSLIGNLFLFSQFRASFLGTQEWIHYDYIIAS